MVTILLNDMLVICIGVLFLCAIWLYHIRAVYRYRLKTLDQVSVQTKADVANQRPWEWRYDVFEQVSFDDMVWKFWRPFESFYPDKHFIEEA